MFLGGCIQHVFLISWVHYVAEVQSIVWAFVLHSFTFVRTHFNNVCYGWAVKASSVRLKVRVILYRFLFLCVHFIHPFTFVQDKSYDLQYEYFCL